MWIYMYINNVKCVNEYTHKIQSDLNSLDMILLVVLLLFPRTSTYFSNKDKIVHKDVSRCL